MRPLCSNCNQLGHLRDSCPRLRPCFHCRCPGHLAKDCPEKSSSKSDAGAEAQKAPRQNCTSSGRSTRVRAQNSSSESKAASSKGNVKDDDELSTRSSSTAATRSDLAATKSCSFCGAPRVTPKHKYGVKACKDRCQSCFRKF